ncbi:hypothetical protein PFUGPA_02423 [Plasmodium falciparum Palo Alto/Uganda]|uniref:Uncharacterized protein n=2 Tax=Plasmodium falciparum TaxID=5833 RepID=W4J037_PLAFP|nr:hypothetical protein PFUGPA_02423 [Plasmodium falciparum Palo Alto/Uganda]ETW59267.1 hypothetical protein PFMC_04746 [Plasmodium falciparum CAMP/Malaysia]
MNLLVICIYYLFFLNIEKNISCSCSTTKNKSTFVSLWDKFRQLFKDKEIEKEKNIITYNFIKHYNDEKYVIEENKKNRYFTGYEINHINRLIYMNSFKTYILSAYIPYIYMSVRDIYIVLKKIKELNFNTVYTFLFWPENEYLEDEYDMNNSKLFYLLNFCASNGLFVILDIGPYINNIYNSNIPTYILFNKKLNDYIRNKYIERKADLYKYFLSPWENIWKRKRNSLIKETRNLNRQIIEKNINNTKSFYKKNNYTYNNIYSLYYFNRVIKWYNYILPQLKKYMNINNGPIIYLNIDKTFDNYYMYIIIDLKRKKIFNNICNAQHYMERSNVSYYNNKIIDHDNISSINKSSSSEFFLNCVISFFRRIRRSYIMTLGYLLYIKFNKYLRVIYEYDLGLLFINEINKLVQKHLTKVNILTTNYPYINDEFINSYAGNNCYNHFLKNNWFDNECINLNKPCIWSQVWTGAKYSIHNVNSSSILKRKYDDHILYTSPYVNIENKVDKISSPHPDHDKANDKKGNQPTEKKDKQKNIDNKKNNNNNKNNNNKNNNNNNKNNNNNNNNNNYYYSVDKGGSVQNKEELSHGKDDGITNNYKDSKKCYKDKKINMDDINSNVKKRRIQINKNNNYYNNNYIGHIRNFKDLTFNIVVFIAKGGVFLNIFPYYSGNNINNIHSYIEHYSKETGQPLDLYFNHKEPLYSHIKRIFKILYKYGNYLLKDEYYINPIKISNNIELYDYDIIKIICNYNIKGSTFVKIGHVNYNINSFSCIIYHEYKKKIIYDTSYNYSYEYSYINKKETYKPIDKYLYSLNTINTGPLMCIKEKQQKIIKPSNKNKNKLSKNINIYKKIFTYLFPNNFFHSVYEINVLNHFYLTMDFTKFQWYILSFKNTMNYVKLFISNYSLYIYIYADNKFIYGGFNEYKFIEIMNCKHIYIICVNLGLGFPKEQVRTEFFNYINFNHLKYNYQENNFNSSSHTSINSDHNMNDQGGPYFNMNKSASSKNKRGIQETGKGNSKNKMDHDNRKEVVNSDKDEKHLKEQKDPKVMNKLDKNHPNGNNNNNKKNYNNSKNYNKDKNFNNNVSSNGYTIFDDLYDYYKNKTEQNHNIYNNFMYDEKNYNMHNYYDEDSTNTYIFIVTRNEYELFNCVGLNGEIIKNEKHMNEYKKMYNFLDYSFVKTYLMNTQSSNTNDVSEQNKNKNKNKNKKDNKGNNNNHDDDDDDNDNNKVISKDTNNNDKNYIQSNDNIQINNQPNQINRDYQNYHNNNFKSLLTNKKIEMKSITKAFLNLCTSGFFSFIFNKIKYYCKTGIFKYLSTFNKVNKNNTSTPLTWYTLLYFIKNIDFLRSKYSLKLSTYDKKTKNIDGLFRGFVYINNHFLGSFWITDDVDSYEKEINEDEKLKNGKKIKKEKSKFLNNENLIHIPLTRYMRIPTDWLVEGTNIVILFDEFGGNPYKVEIVREILHGGVYRLTKKEKYVNWILFLFILSIIVFITYFFFKALHNYFKTKEEKERNKQNYQNIIENIITHNIYINSSYDDITEETNTENIQNVSDFLDS